MVDQKSVKTLLISLVVLFLIALILGIVFDQEILHYSESVLSQIGTLGIMIFIGLNDCFLSIIPPEVILFMLAKSKEPLSQIWIVVGMGFFSSLGGALGWYLSSKIVKPHWFGKRFQGYLQSKHQYVEKYGKLAVAIGAITPVPYSLVCWSAGFLKMNFKDFYLMSLLRIPRYLGYFFVLVFSHEIGVWIKAFF